MTVTGDSPDGHGRRTPNAGTGAIDVLDVVDVCPYLISADGAWRSARPSRDHRCGAIAPAPVLTPEKQRQLCLVDAHRTCATFHAARTRALGPPRPGGRPTPAEPLWPIARTAPVVLESARPSLTSLPGLRGRASGQLALAGLMVVAFLAVILARTSSPGPASTVPPASQSVAVTASPTPRPTPRPTPSPSVSPSAVTSPSASPSAAAAALRSNPKGGDPLSANAGWSSVRPAR